MMAALATFFGGDPNATNAILLAFLILGILAMAGTALMLFLKKRPSRLYQGAGDMLEPSLQVPAEVLAQMPGNPGAPADPFERHRRIVAIENAARELACRAAKDVGVLEGGAPGKIWLLAGPGPQGAIALAAARHLDSLGVEATPQLLAFADKLGDEAARERRTLAAARLRMVESPAARSLKGFAKMIVAPDQEFLTEARKRDLERLLVRAHEDGLAIEDLDEFSERFVPPTPSAEDLVIPASPETLSREEVRLLDALAMDSYGMHGASLMENAGFWAAREAWFMAQALEEDLGRAPRLVAVCGRGNNGGDGFVVARHLLQWGLPCETILLGMKDKTSGEAGQNLQLLEASGEKVFPVFDPTQGPRMDEMLAGADLLIDAILGTGMQGQVRDPAKEVIGKINAARERGAKVLAIDCPSGIDCNTGEALGACVTADLTVTFAANKHGFAKAQGPELCGQIVVCDIGLPRELYRKFAARNPQELRAKS